MKNKLLILIPIIFIFLTGCFSSTPDDNNGSEYKSNNLRRAIDDAKSIMWIGPHPDDEMFISGTLALAGGDKGNKCYCICIVSPDDINPDLNITNRKEAINWFKNTYLEDYTSLNETRPFSWENIKTKIQTIIEEIKPDIIITFSPYGYFNQPDHVATSMTLTELYNSLSYKPEIYYVINMDQDLPLNKKNYEYNQYPPTDIINLNVYSNKLGKTYWNAKIEIWEHYSKSIPDLALLLNNKKLIEKNDRNEYFMSVMSSDMGNIFTITV